MLRGTRPTEGPPRAALGHTQAPGKAQAPRRGWGPGAGHSASLVHGICWNNSSPAEVSGLLPLGKQAPGGKGAELETPTL